LRKSLVEAKFLSMNPFVIARPFLLLLVMSASTAAFGGAGSSKDPSPIRTKEGEAGRTYFRVDVTVEGRAENCVITRSSGYPDLDEAACKNIMKRARFRPGTDDEGRPVRGTYSNSILWKTPQDRTRQLADDLRPWAVP
jgi:TonB family protein